MALTLHEPLSRDQAGNINIAVLVSPVEPQHLDGLARVGGATVEPQTDDDGTLTGAVVRFQWPPKPSGITAANYIKSIRAEVKALLTQATAAPASDTELAPAGTDL